MTTSFKLVKNGEDNKNLTVSEHSSLLYSYSNWYKVILSTLLQLLLLYYIGYFYSKMNEYQELMTHFQEVFIKNLRFFRNKSNFSQLEFSEKIGLSPNYLNAIENGKNFPSAEVIQKIIDTLDIMPYQLFLEQPDVESSDDTRKLTDLKQKIIQLFEKAIENR